jgi:hypothetical protein
MIVFAGIPSESPLSLAIAAAERANLPYVIFNQRHAAHYDLQLTCGGAGIDGSLWLGSTLQPLTAVTGIYSRMMEVTALPEHCPRGRAAPEAEPLEKARAVCGLFDEVLDVLPAIVVNRPAAMGSNLSKPAQAQAIVRAGLLTPPTLVTNVPEAARAFHAAHGRIIYKSISAVRSIVREWLPDSGPDLAAVSALPTQFQAFVPGVNIRVHVVGEQVFATEIESSAIDYRYVADSDVAVGMHPVELAADTAAACIALTRTLGLEMSGIDLKRTPDGECYCFEVNPSPAYSFFEELGGQPIAAALVALLAGKA